MPAFSFLDRLKAHAFSLALLFLMYALAATVGMFSGGVWGGIGIGGALLLALAAGLSEKRFPKPDPVLSFFAFAFLVVGSLSCFPALEPHLAGRNVLKMATVFLPLLFLSSPAIRQRLLRKPFPFDRLAWFLAAGFLSLAAALLVVKFSDGVADKPFYLAKFNRGFSYAALLSWPVLAALFEGGKRRREGWFLLFCLLVALATTSSRAAQTGFLLAGGVFFLSRFFPRFVVWGLGAVLLAALLWPWAAASLFAERPDIVATLPDSWKARIEIWDYMFYRIVENPFFGYGLGNAHLVDSSLPHGNLYVFTGGPASHPHNALIQLWVELGMAGLILGEGFVFWILRRANRCGPYALAAFVFALWLSLTAYNFWTDSFWAAFALTSLAFCLARPARN